MLSDLQRYIYNTCIETMCPFQEGSDSGGANADTSSSTESRVRGLQTMFPDCDKDMLKEMLLENGGSVDAVIDLLTGS